MTAITRGLYTILLALVSPLLLWGLYRSKPNKPSFGKRWREHFGFTLKIENSRNGVIWLHAVSVGEAIASSKLIAELTARYPDKTLLITTTTSTGAEQIAKIIKNLGASDNIVHRYMPIDFSWCVRRFIRIVNPEMMLIIETEIWPNTIHTVANRNIPIVLVNGRLSEKSARNYHRLRLLIDPILKKLAELLVVHGADQDRFIALGVSQQKIKTTGSLKYDIAIDDGAITLGNQLRDQLGCERKVWIAASTHAGEDENVLAAYQQAKAMVPELLLVLVPRHPERFDDVAQLVESYQLKVVRRTQLGAKELDNTVDVYLADTMGEMMTLLAASDIVFMGGSLLGQKVGGHNFIEPAILGKFCITGPSYYNFADLAQQLMAENALSVVEDSASLADVLMSNLANQNEMFKKGIAGKEVVVRNQGALIKTLSAIDAIQTKKNIQ
ncbi:3-deoxy-D-manno-octulosonic acid transferase [Vibrio sinensis]|uniref:3-deoxy-D-manno-octulosonic acid transferase n=1 Tax=Vibrio sinensis TaxID=2302434 RepID=A0A3A6QTU9_9VIBR|nr:lipid IV(A) 3-deoxy-D-manno-octulosonic acid transferase [Vibrio sinensis]RJX72397.1 3-deoxy-D-manno-octulosonic acid transferase [Vibrio sinensis]